MLKEARDLLPCGLALPLEFPQLLATSGKVLLQTSLVLLGPRALGETIAKRGRGNLRRLVQQVGGKVDAKGANHRVKPRQPVLQGCDRGLRRREPSGG